MAGGTTDDPAPPVPHAPTLESNHVPPAESEVPPEVDELAPGAASKGFLMGLADSVPGVSGGTVAYMLGIHPRLVRAISALPSLLRGPGRLRERVDAADTRFLVLLVLGLLPGLYVGARLLTDALQSSPGIASGLLLGLLVATALELGRRTQWKAGPAFAAIVALVLAAWITSASGWQAPDSLWFLPIAGAIAASAMILPGISGSYLLLLMGLYVTVVDAVATFDVVIIGLVGLGAVAGLLAFTRGLRWMLDHHEGLLQGALFGLLLGSLGLLWPWRDVPAFGEGNPIAPHIDGSMAAIVVGFALGELLARAQKK